LTDIPANISTNTPTSTPINTSTLNTPSNIKDTITQHTPQNTINTPTTKKHIILLDLESEQPVEQVIQAEVLSYRQTRNNMTNKRRQRKTRERNENKKREREEEESVEKNKKKKESVQQVKSGRSQEQSIKEEREIEIIITCSIHKQFHQQCSENCKARKAGIFNPPASFAGELKTRWKNIKKRGERQGGKKHIRLAVQVYRELSERNDLDFAMGWGSYLFSPNSEIWKEPQFIKRIQEFSSMPGFGIWISKDQYFSSKNNPLRDWLTEWASLSPVSIPFLMTHTASDAFSNLPSVLAVYHNNPKRSEILWMDSCYGPARGPFATYNVAPAVWRYGSITNKEEMIIPSPHFWRNPIIDENNNNNNNNNNLPEENWPEFGELEKKENQTLELIREKVKLNPNIGGIIMDPINTSKEIQFFTYRFMGKFKKLCLELGLAIIVDEVQTVARSGRFFGFEWYEDFLPDLIIYGKGLATSGIASVGYNRSRFNFRVWDSITAQVDPLSCLKSLQVLKSLRKMKLEEQVSEYRGRLLKVLKELDKEYGREGKEASRGIGYLLWTSLKLPITTARTRILPPIDISDLEIEKAIKLIKESVDQDVNGDVCGICNEEGQVMVCDGYRCERAFHTSCLGYPNDKKKLPNKFFCERHINEANSQEREEMKRKRTETPRVPPKVQKGDTVQDLGVTLKNIEEEEDEDIFWFTGDVELDDFEDKA
jgi:hypothetical protein